jgi:hypothetical protein
VNALAASKSRLLWPQLPAAVQAEVGRIGGGARIVAAQNCPGGFSPGLASRVRLDDGRRLFVKAIDTDAWPPMRASCSRVDFPNRGQAWRPSRR